MKELKKELDHKAFETNLKENKLKKLKRELEKIRNQRRDVCTPNQIQETMNFNQNLPYGQSRMHMNLSMRSQNSFSQSSLVKHTSAIFDNEKLEAKISLIDQLIEEANEKNKWEKFDLESNQHLVQRLRMQKKFDETKIYSLMPEYKSMVRLGENTERLKFLANSANLIAQNGIVQCYSKMQERVEHRIEKVGEKNDIFKEEESVKQKMFEERIFITRNIKSQEKVLRKMKNINERLKFTDEEKQEIERRTKKEVLSIKSFEALIILDSYVKKRQKYVESNAKQENLEEIFQEFISLNYIRKREDLLGTSSLNNTQLDVSLDRTNINNTTMRLRSAHKSPDRSNTNKTIQMHLQAQQSQTLASKMRQFFRKKIEQELRQKKWRDINSNKPSFEYLIDQYQLGQFRLNSTKQTFETLQSQDKNDDNDPEDFNTVNLLIEKIELPSKAKQMKQQHNELLKYKLKIESLETEVLVRVCYRLNQLKLVGKDMIIFQQPTIQMLSEYDLISQAFGLDKEINHDQNETNENLAATQENTVTSQLLSPQSTFNKDNDLNSEQSAIRRAMEQKKKQFIKKSQKSETAPQPSANKKAQKINKQNFAQNFDVMKFLKRVLATKVEEVEDHHKKMLSKYRVVIGQMNQLLQDQEEKIEITDDYQAQSYSKYQSMINQALKRKQEKDSYKTISMNMTLGSQDDDSPNQKSANKASGQKFFPGEQQPYSMGGSLSAKKANDDPNNEEESKIEVEFLNTTRADTKSCLRAKLDLQNQEGQRPLTPSNNYDKQIKGYDAEKNAYQKEVKNYRNVMQNFERQETIFIQKFKKGQDSVYSSITNPNSLRTHKANLYKLFDRSKSTMSVQQLGSGSNNKANSQSQKILQTKIQKQALDKTQVLNKTQFGLDKLEDIQKQVKRHEKILFNLYGSGTPLIGKSQQVRSISRPKTARSIFKNSILQNESILRDTLVIPLGNNQNKSLQQRQTINKTPSSYDYKVEFGYDKSNFGEYLDKDGNLTQKSKPSQQFAFPVEMVKKYHAGIRNNITNKSRSIFTQNYATIQSSTPRMIPTIARPMTALPK